MKIIVIFFSLIIFGILIRWHTHTVSVPKNSLFKSADSFILCFDSENTVDLNKKNGLWYFKNGDTADTESCIDAQNIIRSLSIIKELSLNPSQAGITNSRFIQCDNKTLYIGEKTADQTFCYASLDLHSVFITAYQAYDLLHKNPKKFENTSVFQNISEAQKIKITGPEENLSLICDNNQWKTGSGKTCNNDVVKKYLATLAAMKYSSLENDNTNTKNILYTISVFNGKETTETRIHSFINNYFSCSDSSGREGKLHESYEKQFMYNEFYFIPKTVFSSPIDSISRITIQKQSEVREFTRNSPEFLSFCRAVPLILKVKPAQSAQHAMPEAVISIQGEKSESLEIISLNGDYYLAAKDSELFYIHKLALEKFL